MSTPAETAGAPAALDPVGVPVGAPDPASAPPDGMQVSGRAHTRAEQTPPPPAEPPAETPVAGDPPAKPRPEISDLPPWAQDLIKDTRAEVARTRVEAKKQAAEEAASAATKKVTEDIGRALGLINDDTPPEEQLTPDQLQQLLAGERTSTKMARTELAVFKAANGGTLNASALLDSRSFLDAVKDLDSTDTEGLQTAIDAAVKANPWLAAGAAPAADPGVVADAPAPVAAAPVRSVPPSGGSFAGGPGGQPQDLSTFSIDDFRKLRRDTPRS